MPNTHTRSRTNDVPPTLACHSGARLRTAVDVGQQSQTGGGVVVRSTLEQSESTFRISAATPHTPAIAL